MRIRRGEEDEVGGGGGGEGEGGGGGGDVLSRRREVWDISRVGALQLIRTIRTDQAKR